MSSSSSQVHDRPSNRSTNFSRSGAKVGLMNGGVKKRFGKMINASMLTIGRIQQAFRMSEQPVSGVDSTCRKGLDAMVFMISAENMV
eukprot:2869324-Amphidinium_carterae.1